MYKIIGGDGREYGPVSVAQILQWIAQNRAAAQTLIQPEGAADWVPLGSLPEFAAALGTGAQPPPIPTTAGAPATVPAASARSAEQARACAERPFRFSVFDTLSRGWELLAGRFWLLVGGTLVGAVANAIAGSLPFVGLLASILLTQVFYAGIFWFVLRVARGEPAEIGDVFAGFTRSFGQLVLLSLTMFFVLAALALVAAGPLLWALFRSGVFEGGTPDFSQMAAPLAALPVLIIPMLYLSIAWMFAPILVIDRGLGFWEALELSRRVVGRRWFRMFFLYLAFLPLLLAGLLCLFVGVFVAAALMYTSIVVAYETAFREESAPAANPRPITTTDLRG